MLRQERAHSGTSVHQIGQLGQTMAQWHILRNGNEHGPFDDARLKKLASSGKLNPDDLVRRDDATTVRMAKEIKGLFVSAASSSAMSSSSATLRSTSPGFLQRPALVVLLLTCCFPIGLVLVWIHPLWSQKHKWLLSTVGALPLLLLVAAVQGRKDRSEHRRNSDPGQVPVLTAKNTKRTKSHDSEPTLIRGDSNGDVKLTASFLPSDIGAAWIYSDKTLLPDGSTDFEFKTTIKAQTPDRLVAESVKVSAGTSTPLTTEIRISESSTSVQRGNVPKPGTAPNWEPLVFIGARPGDSWKMADKTQYKLESIEKRGGVQVAVITKNSETALNGERIGLRDEIVLHQGIGLAKRTRYASFNGKSDPYPNYIEELTSFNGKPVRASSAQKGASPQPVVRDRTAPLPDFTTVDYSFDFSKADYSTVPPGAKKISRDQRVDARASEELAGKLETNDGYNDVTGRFIPHGKFITWLDNSKTHKMREGWQLDGKPHGVMTLFFADGSVSGERPYVNGEKHGIHRVFHENGKPSFVHYFINGKEHGVCQGFFNSGQQMYEYIFVSGTKEGRHRTWHDNGQLAVEEFYEHGKRNGSSKNWFRTGALHTESSYRNDLLDGQYAEYSKPSGNEKPLLKKRGTYRLGKMVGEWVVGFDTSVGGYYTVTVNAEKWAGGTREQFLAKMELYAHGEETAINILPRSLAVSSGLKGTALEEFVEAFGLPDDDAPHPDITVARAKPLRRYWTFRCKDGPLVFDLSRSGPNNNGPYALDLVRRLYR